METSTLQPGLVYVHCVCDVSTPLFWNCNYYDLFPTVFRGNLSYWNTHWENHRWWWNSFLISGSSAFYAFLYSMFYLVVKVDVSGDLPLLVYFGYAFIMSLIVFVLTGSIGFGACYLFVCKMFASVKRAWSIKCSLSQTDFPDLSEILGELTLTITWLIPRKEIDHRALHAYFNITTVTHLRIKMNKKSQLRSRCTKLNAW